MNTGGFSIATEADLPRFNGGLYAPGAHGRVEPLPLDADMIGLLVAAASQRLGPCGAGDLRHAA
jgi:hypothetical protein